MPAEGYGGQIGQADPFDKGREAEPSMSDQPAENTQTIAGKARAAAEEARVTAAAAAGAGCALARLTDRPRESVAPGAPPAQES